MSTFFPLAKDIYNDRVYLLKVTETGSEEECQEELQDLLEEQEKTEQEVNTSDMQVK